MSPRLACQGPANPYVMGVKREDDAYVSSCPELDFASQGRSIEEARRNLIEAVELFLETADPSEVRERMHTEVYVTGIEVAAG